MDARRPSKRISMSLVSPQMPKLRGHNKGGINICDYLASDIYLLNGMRARAAWSCWCSVPTSGRYSGGLRGLIMCTFGIFSFPSYRDMSQGSLGHIWGSPAYRDAPPGLPRAHLSKWGNPDFPHLERHLRSSLGYASVRGESWTPASQVWGSQSCRGRKTLHLVGG